MYGYNKERGDAEVMKQINEYRAAAAMFPIIRDVVSQFDGKIYNCRLDKALKEHGHFYSEKRYKWLEINGLCGGQGGHFHMLAQVPLEALPDGKRIPADLIIESARQKRAEYLQKAAEMEQSMQDIETHQKQMEYFMNQFEKLRDSIPYSVRNAYGIDYRISRH